MSSIYTHIAEWTGKGRPLAMATIIQQRGSAPRGIGTKCLILEDGSIVGTIGGGRLEARVLEEARSVLSTGRPARVEFSLTGQEVARTGMLCGGDVEVFIELLSYRDESNLSVLKQVADLVQRGGVGVLASAVDPECIREGEASKFLASQDGPTFGSLCGLREVEKKLMAGLDDFARAGRPVLNSVTDDHSGKSMELYIEPLVPVSRLFVFGGGHVSKELVPLAAGVDFETIVIDDRSEFADPDRFPLAYEVRRAEFEGVMEGLDIHGSTFLVIVTRGHLHDKIVLEQALGSGAGYIGMIGSTRKRDIIYGKLLEEGFSRDDISRVHSPIGLEIGAETPREIAVSIVAELIKVRAEARAATGKGDP